MKLMIFTFILWQIGFALNAAQAATPDIKTPAPVIYLSDNLDEKDNLGWCIDTQGRGFSDKLHAHSCKPGGGDVQFSFDKITHQIKSVAFDNKCATHTGLNNPLQLLDCEDNNNLQKFSFNATNKTFHPKEETEACLAVGDSSRSAGPFMSRELLISECSKTDMKFKVWVIKQ